MDAAHVHRWAVTEVKINNRTEGTAQASILVGFKKDQVHPKNSPG